VRKLESDLNEEKILIYSLSTETKIGRDFSIFFRNISIPSTYLINNKGEIMNKWKTSPNQEHVNVLLKRMRE
jgi:peroxiredoxin